MAAPAGEERGPDGKSWLETEPEAARVARQAADAAYAQVRSASDDQWGSSIRFGASQAYDDTFVATMNSYMQARFPRTFAAYSMKDMAPPGDPPISRMDIVIHLAKLLTRMSSLYDRTSLASYVAHCTKAQFDFAVQRIPTSTMHSIRKERPYSRYDSQGEDVTVSDLHRLSIVDRELSQRDSLHMRPAVAQSGLIDHLRMRDTNAADYLAQWTSAGVTPQRPLADHSDWIRTPLASTREALARELEALSRAVRSGVPAAQVRARLARARDSVPVEDEPAAKRAAVSADM